jgi:lipopolysaccharide/colanic/teichoic acid biosynthesis glycosyltransferase
LRRLDMLPGLTGLWQVTARHDPSFQKNVMLDLEYIQNWTIWMDLKIIMRTIPEVFRGSGR